MYFDEQETAQKMMQTTVPSEHQALGRKAKGFDRKKWDERESCVSFNESCILFDG